MTSKVRTPGVNCYVQRKAECIKGFLISMNSNNTRSLQYVNLRPFIFMAINFSQPNDYKISSSFETEELI